MNRILRNIIYIISITLILIMLIYNNHTKSGVKSISIKHAEYAIVTEYLNDLNIEDGLSNNNSPYRLVKIIITNQNSSRFPLMVKRGYPFYVFQNRHLIYTQKDTTYYQGLSIKNNTYLLNTHEVQKKQILHQIPLHSHDPIYILIKNDERQKIDDIISLSELKQKNIKNLTNTAIPVIKINTHTKYLDSKKYRFTSTEILYKDTNYVLLSKMKIRGTSSLSFPKKQFNMVFEEENDLNGLRLKKNVLLASFMDKSLIRNKLSCNLFSLFNQTLSPSKYIHLIVNDMYEGVYLLREHPQTQFEKFIRDTKKLNFLLKIDRGPYDFYAESNTGYLCEYPNNHTDNIIHITRWLENGIVDTTRWLKNNTLPREIKPGDPFNIKMDYLQNQFNLSRLTLKSIIEKANEIISLSNGEWEESVREKTQRRGGGNTFYQQALQDAYWLLYGKSSNYQLDFSKIDINSFIDLITLNELSKNIDAYRLSTYLSYIDNVFKINIVWDFDLSWGLPDYNEGFNHEGFIIDSDIKKFIPDFWCQLWGNELIQQKIKNRYKELRLGVLSNIEIENNINDIYNQINLSTIENFERWDIIGEPIWPNKFNFKSYEKEVDYLKQWAHKRLQWLDLQWNTHN